MTEALHHWRRLLEPEHRALVDAAEAADPSNPSAVMKLRKLGDAELVRLALQLTAARRKAADKFPGIAKELVADPTGVEQASSLACAEYKAQRFAEAGFSEVLDLCCGIGGDAMGMRSAGIKVTGFDCDPVRAWMFRQNVGGEAVVTDVSSVNVAGRAIHLDPARRNESGRIFDVADYLPPIGVIRQLIHDSAAAAVKLAPGIDREQLLTELGLAEHLPAEVAFISENGRMVQAVLWVGEVARHTVSATMIRQGCVETISGDPTVMPPAIHRDELPRYLHTVDPAAERAELLGVLCDQHGLTMPHPALGLLVGERCVASPWLSGFELIAAMPWRRDKVKAWLEQHQAGIVEVKTRGKAVDPDHEQTALRGAGDERFTVFILRWDRQVRALITRRV